MTQSLEHMITVITEGGLIPSFLLNYISMEMTAIGKKKTAHQRVYEATTTCLSPFWVDQRPNNRVFLFSRDKERIVCSCVRLFSLDSPVGVSLAKAVLPRNTSRSVVFFHCDHFSHFIYGGSVRVRPRHCCCGLSPRILNVQYKTSYEEPLPSNLFRLHTKSTKHIIGSGIFCFYAYLCGSATHYILLIVSPNLNQL